MLFRDRREAGKLLAERLIGYRARDPVVLALPRGGVPVACEIAAALDAPLDVLLVRKIGVPSEPELALGAVVDGATPDLVIDEQLMAALDIPQSYVESESKRQLAEIERRRRVYLGDRQPLDIKDRTAIVVDDGIATGNTMRVALRALARRSPGAVVLAIPVAPPAAIELLRPEVTDIVCLETPSDFLAIGQFYEDFAQLRDDTVVQLLRTRTPEEKGESDATATREA
jgi:putative phosphoribosyl transferase